MRTLGIVVLGAALGGCSVTLPVAVIGKIRPLPDSERPRWRVFARKAAPTRATAENESLADGKDWPLMNSA
jgi:hypothetical protein